MSDEIRVSIQPDQGIKNQWARGLFYRQDGNKRTLIPKNMMIVGAVIFLTVTVSLLLQDPPEKQKSTVKGGLTPLPTDMSNNLSMNIPPADITQSDAYGDSRRGSSRRSNPSAGAASASSAAQKSTPFKGPQVVNRPNSGRIPPGSMIKATLLSGASNGPVRAEVSEAFSFNGEPLLEEGTILLGEGQSGEDRLSIRFNQLIFRDGSVNSINATACDGDDKIPGIKGSKLGSQALKLGMGIGLNFVGGMSEALQDTDGQSGAVIRRPTLRNALLNGAATATLDQSREIMSNIKNKTPVIEVSSGTFIYVLFQGN